MDLTCGICFEHTSDEESLHLECSHVFHAMCFYTWWFEKPSCPYCRALMTLGGRIVVEIKDDSEEEPEEAPEAVEIINIID